MKKLIILAIIGLGIYSCTTYKPKNMQKAKLKPETWKHNTNIYEVNVRQFTKEGTFSAFAKELPRLKKMGVKTIWFMPITPISKEKMKGSMGSPYACSDYTSINPEFGTLEDFKKVVREAHNLEMNVIIDWVANHTGWDHVWTKTHPDYYLHDADGSFHIASGMDDIIELDYGNPELRNAMIEAMKFWVKETDIDGFRCDLASWVELDFWKQARPEVEKVKPLFFLGEYDELEQPEYGKVFDASYSWTWMHKTEAYYKENLSLQELKDLLIKYSQIGDNSMRAWFTTNHDENTWNGTEFEKYGAIAKPLAVFSATWNGVPLMYSGQEMPNKKRLKFFDKDPIEWTGNFEYENFYKTLFKLRNDNPALRGGDPNVQTFFINTTAESQILAYIRKNGAQEVLVALNMSKDSVTFQIDDQQVQGRYKNVFTKELKDFTQDNKISLQVSDFVVFER